MPSHKFYPRLLALTAMQVLAIFALNILVNPYLEYPVDMGLKGYEEHLPQVRSVKMLLYERQATPPQAVILGNSRAMSLPPQTLQTNLRLSAFNAAVNSGSPYDFVALTRYILDQPDSDLQVLVVNIDPFMFDQAIDVELRRYPLAPYFSQADARNLEWNRLKRTLSSDALWRSIGLLWHNLFEGGSTDFSSDGLYITPHFDEDTHNGPDPALMAEFKQAYSISYDVENFLGAEEQAFFEQWLQLTQDENICVILVMLPLHSEIISVLKTNTRYDDNMQALHDYLEGLQQAYRFEVHDLSRVETFGGDETWFTDGSHFLPPLGDQIIDAITRNSGCKATA